MLDIENKAQSLQNEADSIRAEMDRLQGCPRRDEALLLLLFRQFKNKLAQKKELCAKSAALKQQLSDNEERAALNLSQLSDSDDEEMPVLLPSTPRRVKELVGYDLSSPFERVDLEAIPDGQDPRSAWIAICCQLYEGQNKRRSRVQKSKGCSSEIDEGAQEGVYTLTSKYNLLTAMLDRIGSKLDQLQQRSKNMHHRAGVLSTDCDHIKAQIKCQSKRLHRDARGTSLLVKKLENNVARMKELHSDSAKIGEQGVSYRTRLAELANLSDRDYLCYLQNLESEIDKTLNLYGVTSLQSSY